MCGYGEVTREGGGEGKTWGQEAGGYLDVSQGTVMDHSLLGAPSFPRKGRSHGEPCAKWKCELEGKA